MSKSPHICIKEELYKRYTFAIMIYIQFPQRCQVKKANYRIQIYEWIDEAKLHHNLYGTPITDLELHHWFSQGRWGSHGEVVVVYTMNRGGEV